MDVNCRMKIDAIQKRTGNTNSKSNGYNKVKFMSNVMCLCLLVSYVHFFTQFIVASSDLENAFVVSLWCDVDAV